MSEFPKYDFEMTLKVRDYETDSQGIVNNAIYLHYLEHTRHEFCEQRGVSFRALQRQGLDPVVRRVEIDYLTPLGLGAEMRSCLRVERQGPRFIFFQDIYLPDGRPVVKARVIIVGISNGRISRGDEIAQALGING